MLKMIGLGLALILGMCGAANAQLAGLTPCAGKSLSVTVTTGNVQLSNCGPVVILYNTTTQEAYFNLASASTTTAVVATSFYIPASGFIVLQQPQGSAWYLAGITPSATTTFKIVQGTAKP